MVAKGKQGYEVRAESATASAAFGDRRYPAEFKTLFINLKKIMHVLSNSPPSFTYLFQFLSTHLRF